MEGQVRRPCTGAAGGLVCLKTLLLLLLFISEFIRRRVAGSSGFVGRPDISLLAEFEHAYDVFGQQVVDLDNGKGILSFQLRGYLRDRVGDEEAVESFTRTAREEVLPPI